MLLRYYHEGSHTRIPKSIVRGWLHLVMLLISPIWVHGFWSLANLAKPCEHVWLWSVSVGSIILLLSSSTWYHFPTHSSEKMCDHVKKIDMIMVALSMYINVVPTLMFYDLFPQIVIYGIAVLAILTGVILGNARNSMITSSVLSLVYTIIDTVPSLIFRSGNISAHPLLLLPLITGTLVMAGIAVLYIWSDNDQSGTVGKPLIIATHDVIHFLSLLVVLNLGYYNSYLLSLM